MFEVNVNNVMEKGRREEWRKGTSSGLGFGPVPKYPKKKVVSEKRK